MVMHHGAVQDASCIIRNNFEKTLVILLETITQKTLAEEVETTIDD